MRSLDPLSASDEFSFAIFNTARPVGTILSGHGYAVLFLGPSRGPGVASTVLGWLAAGRVLGLWSGTPSLNNSAQRKSQVLHVGRFLRACAALGIPAGEHSSFDSVPVEAPLRSRVQRWSFSHVDFCAGGGRFRKRTGMLFIHCGTPSCRSLQCRSTHRVCTFTGPHHQHGENLDKMSSPRWKPACLNALLSLSRTPYDIV